MVTEATAHKPHVQWLNLVFLLGTLLIALIGPPWYILKVGLGWPEALTFVILYLFVGLSVTAGYHRLFAHKTYSATWPVRLFFLIFGAAALENSILNWAADHRVHHAHVDEERDPYNITKGFWWAHIGWIFYKVNEPIPKTVVRDLEEDPLVRWQDRYYVLIGLGVALGIPLAVGFLTGNVLGCLLIGGVVRIVASHHTTFFINSLCHMVGRRPYSTEHSARDSGIMAVFAFGEGYHNYHHSFPFDYRNGVKPWQFDPAKWIIWTLSRLGLARDLRRAPEAAILKAKIEVQFEKAKERLQQVVHDFREQHEARLHERYESLQKALHELLTLQRRQKRPVQPEEEHLPFETRVGLTYHALEQALQEWKQTLRQMDRLPVAATA
ncbi:MAG TPA: fatty acid desaturase [Thermoanaerobaculia bacterium]|nr:fatty acid desaturase [Thermoanaerobaculia bacterium]